MSLTLGLEILSAFLVAFFWLGIRFVVPFFKRAVYPDWMIRGWPDWLILTRGLAFFPVIGPMRLIDYLIRRYVEPKDYRDSE
jgi:hypothetical protein